MRILLSILFSICLLTSCSIEKRLYLKGYRVEWNSTEKQPVGLKETNSKSTSEIRSLIKSIDTITIPIADNKTIQPLTGLSSFEIRKENKDTTHFKPTKKKTDGSNGKVNAEKQPSTLKPNRAANISFVFACVALAGLMVSLTLGFSVFILFALLGIPAIIFGAVALKQIKREPDTYSNKWFAIVAIVMGSLELLFFLLLVTALALFLFY